MASFRIRREPPSFTRPLAIWLIATATSANASSKKARELDGINEKWRSDYPIVLMLMLTSPVPAPYGAGELAIL